VRGFHTVAADKKCSKKVKKGEIKLENSDPRWSLFPCRVYFFYESEKQCQKMAQRIGIEDNHNYALVFSLFLFF